ncbi:tripartite tricarboxylate transporter substrate binding protein [Variovorax defluvii]|uniref:Tripartite tricarboxylate transporter substrate binding protein n=2 Tax=Variovorax defluvii TaxID=913761 RepID=A0ABP8I9K0_9BURK
MNTRQLLLATFGLLIAATLPAQAQTFPEKPVKVVMPYPAGTGPDAVMRHVGERLAKVWGQQVVVENKPGANGWIGLDTVNRSAADGYTFLLVDQAIMSLHPYLYKKMPLDPAKDFVPVAPMYSTNYFIAVAANSKLKTFADLMAEAKRRGSPLTYGSSGVGGQLHIGGALVEAAAGVPMTHVPNKDVPQMYVDVSEERVDFAFATAATAGPLQKAGKLKYIAFAAPKRHPRYPDVPTVAESGGPADLQVSTWIALFAPTGAPPAVVNKVSADVAKIIATPETQEFLANIGFIAWSGSAKELGDTMKKDSAGYSDFVKKFKLSLD